MRVANKTPKRYYSKNSGKKGTKPSPNIVRTTGKKVVSKAKDFNKKKKTPIFTSATSYQ